MHPKHSAAMDSCTENRAAERAPMGRPRSVERAKHLPLRSNSTLGTARVDAAITLGLALLEKEESIAAALGVTRTNVARWLNPEWADAKPAPLAMLLALDDAAYARAIRGLDAMRKARKERA